MGRPTKKEIWKRNISYGVTKMTPEVIQKFEQAFAIGATIAESCDYANVSPSTYHNWVNKNPELLDKFDRMRQKLPLKSKENIARRIHGEPVSGDISLSKWLIERQQPEKYGETIKMQHIGEIATDVTHPEDEELRLQFKSKLKENIRRRAIEKKNPII